MSRTYLCCPEAFTGEECDSILAFAPAEPESASVWTHEAYGVDRDSRNSGLSLLGRDERSEWLFARLDGLFAKAAGPFGLPVGPVRDMIQILRYDVGGHFIRWHSDAGLDRHEQRRISLSVELSAPEDYEGGLLEIVPDLIGGPRSLPRGSVHLFPSRALHHVTEVKRGTRWSLVAWTGAPEWD